MRRVIFFDDELETQRGFAAQLRSHGFDLLAVKDLDQAEAEMSKDHCELIVYGGGGPESWQLMQNLVNRNPDFPVLYIFVNDDGRAVQTKCDELHAIVRPLTSRARFLELVEQLIRVGRLHRRLEAMSQLGTGSVAVEQMFVKLDVHHILDRTLEYFGTRIEVANLHWVRWQELPHFLQGDRDSLALETEISAIRSPRLMSYREAEPIHLFELLWQTLKPTDLENLCAQQFRIQRAGAIPVLYVMVKSLDEVTPLGLIVVEGIQTREAELLAPQLLESIKLMARFIEFGLAHWDGKNLALVDDLTDLFNQRYLPTVLENEINRAKRREGNFTLLFMDLDYFKLVNDTRGHWVGSKLLREVGQILRGAIRSCDFGFRYGGDEFVVILPDTDLKGGQVVAERIRKSVEDMRFLIDGHEIRLTVSVGLAAYPEHAKTKEQMIQLADQAMYYGKRKSRNVVYCAS